MQFDLYRPNGAEGRYFPSKVSVHDEKSFIKAVKYDNTGVEFKDGFLNKDCFLSSNVILFDCNNSHSGNPADWITSVDFLHMLPSVNYAIVYPKRFPIDKLTGRERPCFRVYFPISEQLDEKAYTVLKKIMQKVYPFFSSASVKPTTLFTGIRNTEYFWHEGVDDIDVVFMSLTELDEKTLFDMYGFIIADDEGGGDAV